MSANQQFCLRWNNHSSNFVTVFSELLKSEAFTDVTIAVDERTIKCHKMVLAACSSYFQELFIKTQHDHPIVLITDVRYPEMQSILDYMYRGEVNVAQDQLPGLLKAAAFLKVKGLVHDPESSNRPEVDMPMSPAPQVNGYNGAHSNDFLSPSNLSSTSYAAAYGKSPTERNNQIALWAAHWAADSHLLASRSQVQNPVRDLGSSYENMADPSPLSRKKMAVRENPILRNVLSTVEDAPVQQNGYANGPPVNGAVSPHEPDRRNSSEVSEPMVPDDEEQRKVATPQKHKGKEWKRYKQYSRQDMANAMSSVRKKEMSALQAASKFNIPSRTLYDKLKKAGILPIRNAAKRRSDSAEGMSPLNGAQFPYAGPLNGAVYGNNNGSAISESESDPTDHSNGLARANEYEDVAMDMTSPRSSPAIRNGVIANGHASPSTARRVEDHVEDLSINNNNNRPPNGVIMPSAIKEEELNED